MKIDKDADEITRYEINYYLLECDCNTSLFYGISKIHKSNLIKEKCKATSSEFLELLNPDDLTCRPAVARTTCKTHRLSNMTDILLKSFIQNVKICISDDISFLTRLLNKIPDNSLLATFDVRLETIELWLDKFQSHTHKRFSKSFILEGTEISLQNDNFIFNDQCYNQNKGTAMGTKFAPTYATLVLYPLDEKMYDKLRSKDPELGLYHNIQKRTGKEL